MQRLSSRLTIASIANILKTFISVYTITYIGNALTTEEFGNYIFVLSLGSALAYLLDFNLSEAFAYRVIGKEVPHASLIVTPFIALFSLISGSLLLVVYFQYLNTFENIQLITLLFAFYGSYLMLILWKYLTAVFEGLRKTIITQSMLLMFSVAYWLLLQLYSPNAYGILIKYYFIVVFLVTLIYFIILYFYRNKIEYVSNISVMEYVYFILNYSRPLVLLNLLVFGYNWMDRYFVGIFSGLSNLASFGIANQFSLLITILISAGLKIFNSEVVIARNSRKVEKVAEVYNNFIDNTISVFGLGTVFIIPLLPLINELLYDEKFDALNVTMAVMFLGALFQGVGQLMGIFLLATDGNKIHARVGVVSILFSFPLVYVLIGPVDYGGLNLGSLGIALKLLLINFFSFLFLDKIMHKEYRTLRFGLKGCIFLTLAFFSALIGNLATGSSMYFPILVGWYLVISYMVFFSPITSSFFGMKLILDMVRRIFSMV